MILSGAAECDVRCSPDHRVAGAYRRRLTCPWLVCVGEADQVAAPGPAIRAGRQAPRGVVRTYAGVDHFDIYDGPAHDAVIADQLDFLSGWS